MPVVNEESPPIEQRRVRYPKQVRKDAAALVVDQHRSVDDVARELGIVEQTLGNWVHGGLCRDAIDMATPTRCGEAQGMIFQLLKRSR